MALFPSILIALGLLVVPSVAQLHFTRDGNPCIALHGKPAQCAKYDDKTIPWCYTSAPSNSFYCNANYAEEFRCSSKRVTRHGNCEPASEEFCCSADGICGNSIANHCNCTDCKNLREEACTHYNCNAKGDCYWDTAENKTSCKCHEKYHKDPARHQCYECLGNDHCEVLHYACIGDMCVDPCINYQCNASTLATCEVSNRQPFCLCPDGYKLVGEKDCALDPSEFVVISSVSSCFFLSPAKFSWNSADAWCKKYNTTLAQPKDLKMLRELQSVTNVSAVNFWLGGHGNGQIMTWNEGAEEVYPGSSDIWEQGHPGSMVNSSFCTLYNSSDVHGMLSSQMCTDAYNFICQIDKCEVPDLDGSPVLKNFSETSITVLLPSIKETKKIQSLYVVVVVGRKNISGVLIKPKPSFAEDIARLKFRFTTEEKPWIAKTLPSPNSTTENIVVIGDDHPLVQNNEYFVALVVATKQGDFTLYNSTKFGGPFFATEYRRLRIRDLLTTAGVTSITLWLGIGIYALIQRWLGNSYNIS